MPLWCLFLAAIPALYVAFGILIGRTAHFTAEADTHYCNLFLSLVGTTSKGRKGTMRYIRGDKGLQRGNDL